jgi:nucleotide-binding universal stress UspA family protein
MNPWLVLLALIVLAAVLVVVPVATATRSYWRRPWQVRCPRAARTARISVDAARAALGEVLGQPAVLVGRCSLWQTFPQLTSCSQECLTVTDAERRPLPPGGRRSCAIRTIVVPLDGTRGSEAVLATAADLARAHRAHLRLVRVAVPPPLVRAHDDRVLSYADQEAARVERDLQTYLTGIACGLGEIDVQTVVRFGDPAREILEEAERSDADLIAMASHHRWGLGRLFSGSIAARVARGAEVPVVLVRHQELAAVGGRP